MFRFAVCLNEVFLEKQTDPESLIVLGDLKKTFYEMY